MQDMDFGVIGNCKSAALVYKTGSIDWACLPEFDSPSVFGRLLDKDKGGVFEIKVSEDYTIEQEYLKRTNILATRFTNGQDAFEVIDFMPRYKTEDNNYFSPPEIHRLFRVVSGSPSLRVIYQPRLQYARYDTKTTAAEKYIKSHTTKGTYDSLYLYTNVDYHRVLNGDPFTLNHTAYFVISYNQKLIPLNVDQVELEMERTKVYWLNWVNRTVQYKAYQEQIERSALVLKLLTYQRTGAIIAAVTTSLPESIGGERNWDYRYCWIRDASMIIKTLIDLGHKNAAHRFMKFVTNLLNYKDERIQIMYGIRGEKKLTEKILEHLQGFENSKPVRVGNAAYLQKQNDIYGVLMDIIYRHFHTNHQTLDEREAFWTIVRSILKTVKNKWKSPDKSIWEIRSQSKHFTFSKVLSWVAFDRGEKIAGMLGQEDYAKAYKKTKDLIRQDIYKKGWNTDVQAFTQSYGSQYMDAANLLMERYGFIDAHDPRYVSTVKKTKQELLKNDLMYRYINEDDFGKPSTSFTICTFWMITSLHKIGEKEEAQRLFNNIIKYTNHVGLLSEDMEFDTYRLLGNFPQGYSHLAMIEAAITLAEDKTEFLPDYWMP